MRHSLRRDHALRIPHRVPRGIKISAHFFVRRLRPDRIPLHSQRIHLERIGAAPVMERIEHYLDRIVVGHIFPACLSCPRTLPGSSKHTNTTNRFFCRSPGKLPSSAKPAHRRAESVAQSRSPSSFAAPLRPRLHGEEVVDRRPRDKRGITIAGGAAGWSSPCTRLRGRTLRPWRGWIVSWGSGSGVPLAAWEACTLGVAVPCA